MIQQGLRPPNNQPHEVLSLPLQLHRRLHRHQHRQNRLRPLQLKPQRRQPPHRPEFRPPPRLMKWRLPKPMPLLRCVNSLESWVWTWGEWKVPDVRSVSPAKTCRTLSNGRWRKGLVVLDWVLRPCRRLISANGVTSRPKRSPRLINSRDKTCTAIGLLCPMSPSLTRPTSRILKNSANPWWLNIRTKALRSLSWCF